MGSPSSSSPPKEFTFVGSGFAQCVANPNVLCLLMHFAMHELWAS